MENNQKKVKNISFIERIILFIAFSILPVHFLLDKFLNENLSWDRVSFINIVSITYSVILILVIIIQIFINKPYLGLIFGCHQKHDRSFNFSNKYLKICSRCSGILIGILLMPLLSNLKINLNYFLLGIFPLLIDGFIQYFSKIKSTNFRRIITGIMFGPALIVVSSYYYLLLSKLIVSIASKIA